MNFLLCFYATLHLRHCQIRRGFHAHRVHSSKSCYERYPKRFWKSGTCHASKIQKRWLTLSWTTATRIIATQVNCHPDNCHLGQLPPRTIATQDNCHPGQLPPGQLPHRTTLESWLWKAALQLWKAVLQFSWNSLANARCTVLCSTVLEHTLIR